MGLATLAALACGLSACGTSYPVTSPSDARTDTAATTIHAMTTPSRHAPADQAGSADQGNSVDCRKAKCVALSFDAGPSENTPRLLSILQRYDAHATFFLLGKNHVLKYPGVVRRMADADDESGNHTWTHQILTEIEPAKAREELALTQDAIERITGREPTLMRPPQGRTNAEVTRIRRQLGLSQVLWSVTAKDYETTDSALIRQRVLDQTRRDGIILLHDIYAGTLPAVPGILAELDRPGMVYRP
ncbi:polysaccharide deacetylase family protein [Actinopolymorpha pittospori]|uniref:polysaccharide deacetylase family protein n=1 Tax=Actinopolymorpha pittospori TaxID=648752 RepID=UPI0031E6E011